MATSASDFSLHRPIVGKVAQQRSGVIEVAISEYPVTAALFFSGIDAAEDFVLALGREIIAIRNKGEVSMTLRPDRQNLSQRLRAAADIIDEAMAVERTRYVAGKSVCGPTPWWPNNMRRFANYLEEDGE